MGYQIVDIANDVVVPLPEYAGHVFRVGNDATVPLVDLGIDGVGNVCCAFGVSMVSPDVLT